MGKKRKYAIEVASEKLLNQIRISLKKFTDFYTTIPRKEQRMFWLLQVGFGFSLIYLGFRVLLVAFRGY